MQSDQLAASLTSKINEIYDTAFSGSSGVVGDLFANWMDIIAAILILLFGWIFGSMIEKLILKLVSFMKFHIISEKLKFQDFLDKAHIKYSPTEIAVKFIKGYIFMFFFLAAARLMQLNYIGDFLDSIIAFLPRIVVALLIVLVGFNFANTTASFLNNTLKMADPKSALLLAGVAKYIIITFTVLAALNQIEIAGEFIDIMFIGVVSTLSLALGLSLGIGGAKFVANRLEEFSKSDKKRK